MTSRRFMDIVMNDFRKLASAYDNNTLASEINDNPFALVGIPDSQLPEYCAEMAARLRPYVVRRVTKERWKKKKH